MLAKVLVSKLQVSKAVGKLLVPAKGVSKLLTFTFHEAGG
jgi:hypothetical protein